MKFKIKNESLNFSTICRNYDITNYTINEDGSIDVYENINLSWIVYGRLSLRFNRVTGNFNCSHNKLISLAGMPKYVSGHFACMADRLTSLEYAPKYIGGNFYFNSNNITSLEGFPEYVGGNIDCSNNPINSIVKYFIHRDDNNNLIELFNYYDIVQDMSVIYDRLIYFYECIDIEVTNVMLREIKNRGYNIIK